MANLIMFKSLYLNFLISKEQRRNRKIIKKENLENLEKQKASVAKFERFVESVKAQFLDEMIDTLIKEDSYSTHIKIDKAYSGINNLKQRDALELCIDTILSKRKLLKKINVNINYGKIDRNTFNVDFSKKNY